ncbi:MAG: hypothetical protein CFE23_09930 [Flavobacterium sp. BFFFF1]|uniref:hypothetical protein n=1 Tax=Flavobacterium sp. BFFFF1 TaxID=2015557 RepID=UPI000BC3AE6E|nr:hypothetical protein [Flavobacterium sp. BFFFF1]OYU80374.1 MAG: hypothetical protein CFE23_09930 [Flavobacterium sp. BFFFF1]
MFNKIQNYLLINHPLLWNTKIVPALVAGVLFNIIFFLLGYSEGTVYFKDNDYYYDGNSASIIFFSVLISILFFVVWIVYYTRNNAYKSFYQLQKFALYKEWLIILAICMLNVNYTLSYLTGKEVRVRTYFSYEETKKRCETIGMASVFIDGGHYTPSANSNEPRTLVFNGQEYPVGSLINNSGQTFRISGNENPELKVKKLMQQDNQQQIKKIMRDYFALIKEHGLNTNLTPEQWFDMTYSHPHFTDYELIGKGNGNNDGLGYTAGSYTYNLPHNALVNGYQRISNSWFSPLIEDSTILFTLYFGLAISMLVFGYKVTTGRNLLIAVISFGLLWILFGIMAVLSSSGKFIPYACLILVVAMMAYFLSVINSNEGKRVSGIVLNILLWSLGAVLPIIYCLLMDYYSNTDQGIRDGGYIYSKVPQYEWLLEHLSDFTFLNILFIALFMLYMTENVRKWKGTAES